MNRKRFWVIIFCVVVALSVWAKDGKDSLYIIGWPCDAFTMNPVIDKTRVELLTPDSTVIATAVPAGSGQNPYDAYFALKVGVRSGNFIVRLTHPDYHTLTKAFTLKVAKREPNFSLGNLKMRRLPQTRQLGEAVARATKIKFYTKGDTLIYNADAFNLAEGSMLDALVGYDILGQLSNITCSVNSQGSVETWRNVIPRYGMVRVIFRFNKQPKKKP